MMGCLYEILDKKLVEEQILEGVRRLLDLLREEVSMCEDILEPRNELLGELKEQLLAVHSVLSALAIPANYQGFSVLMVTDAFHVIDEVLRAYWQHQEWVAEYRKKKAAASETSSAQTESGSVSLTPSETDSSAALERQSTRSRDDHSPAPDSPQSPFLKFMNKLDAELGAKAGKMKKVEVKLHIKQRWDADVLGDPSAHLLDVMATLMRPPQSQKGGAKPQALNR